MISLRDSIEIRATPGRIFEWLGRMPQEYTSWHPDHVACRVGKGSMLEVGSIVECEEYLHGKLHSMRFRTTKVDLDKRVEFGIIGMGRGAFDVKPVGEKVLFTAELDIGTEVPVVGSLVDFVFIKFFSQRLEAMREHMKEEGHNLKEILETDLATGAGHEAA